MKKSSVCSFCFLVENHPIYIPKDKGRNFRKSDGHFAIYTRNKFALKLVHESTSIHSLEVEWEENTTVLNIQSNFLYYCTAMANDHGLHVAVFLIEKYGTS